MAINQFKLSKQAKSYLSNQGVTLNHSPYANVATSKAPATSYFPSISYSGESVVSASRNSSSGNMSTMSRPTLAAVAPTHAHTYDPGQMLPGAEGDVYTYDDSELFNQQLQNAYLMQQLGYSVDFKDGEMQYSKIADQPSYTPYGAYGYGESSPYVYETDWLAQNQAKTQMPRENYYYKPSNYDYSGYSNYGYYGDSYNNQYYSRYGQRYSKYRRQYKKWYRRSDGYANGYNSRRRSSYVRSW